jgi:dolichol-phosphate mannosyltransferase
MNVLIVPTYNESETLPVFFDCLLGNWSKDDLIIIADDSEELHRQKIRETVKKRVDLGYKLFVIEGKIKGGRGAAVRRAIHRLFEEKIDFSYVIETDADGSHRAQDVWLLRDFDYSAEFVIGSRYLRDSRIEGWSISRRILSRSLNFIIPRIIGIQTSDITNGLRRYSFKASEILIKEQSLNSGFIYLTEQALCLSRKGIQPADLPIEFLPRISGNSSVTLKDLLDSFSGFLRILKMRNKKK